MNMLEAVKKAIHYSAIQNILQYYICPEDCAAHCCKHGRIHIFEEEYENFYKIDSQKAYFIKHENPPSPLYKIETPCAFLKAHDRCGVYYQRPIVCGLYPFKVNSSGESIGLQPCPIGYLIMQEFSKWVVNNIEKTQYSQNQKTEVIRQWEKTIASYAKELEGFHNNNELQELQIPFEDLERFSIFINSLDLPKINSGIDLG